MCIVMHGDQSIIKNRSIEWLMYLVRIGMRGERRTDSKSYKVESRLRQRSDRPLNAS
jgi:hypothetical protein